MAGLLAIASTSLFFSPSCGLTWRDSRCPVPGAKRALVKDKRNGPSPFLFSNGISPNRIAASDRGLVAVRSFAHLVEKVTAEELDKLLEGERLTPIVVDFFATWCGPCVILAQELEKLAAEYANKVKFVKIDTDEEYELATEMEIRGLPTLVFISTDANKNAIRTEGLLPSETIRDIIDNEL